MKFKWPLRILGVLMFLFPFVMIAMGVKNTSYLLIGMVGAILFIASFTFIRSAGSSADREPSGPKSN